MKIIFDFDHTLFSAKKLYSALKEAFFKLRVDENLFQETFEESKGIGRDYKPSQQFELIAKQKPEIPLKKLKKDFKKILKTAPRFLYSDALSFLKKWSREADLILLSYGEEKFQKDKIKASKVGKYFKKIIITRDIEKLKPFSKIFTHLPRGRVPEKIIFVEDNPVALSETKKVFKNVITIRINRGEGKYSREPDNSKIDFSIKNLKELDKILKSL